MPAAIPHPGCDGVREVGLIVATWPLVGRRKEFSQVTAAISVAAPVQRMTKKNVQTTIPSVVSAADAISRRLGYMPSLSHLAE